MRILSQDGVYDVPYEMVGIYRNGDQIHFLNKNFSGYGVVAAYSTNDKAKKAMEMLREAYQRMKWVPTVIEDGEIAEQQGWHCNEYFQFPADDEIDV